MTARAFGRVLCPVDFSGPSRTALRYAAAIVGSSDGEVTVLFVNDPLLTAAATAGYDAQALARTTDLELRTFVRKALSGSRPGARAVRIAFALGKPAREIVKAARRFRADLIVMGTRGSSGVSKLVLGSTTEQVLRKTGIPVLAVPPGAARLLRNRRASRRR